MTSESRWKIVDLKWWNKPIPLWRKSTNDKPAERIGWVWNQKAYIVNNLLAGWIAFVDDQTHDKLSIEDIWRCPYCNASIWGGTREKIIKHVKGEA